MTQISLRAYIREIDGLIERELLDEAIAHCRHILQTYPKHIETYRLLGKSYLEAKRYGDAADIFQRVLSAVPDDFVSHIGMAIVREDEANLDSAIWHMERAFETNPANPAIQQELRRLIGRRDGFEPHKVRLTRGALARMYAQGELYPQAIAELQSALQEDPERPDLQVLLADMLWQTDQKIEAAEVSRQILEKLPFCQKAGRIMAAVYQEQGKSNEGTAYHRRLAQLDPYAAYVEYPMVDTVRVEADTVRIERLDWHPGQPLPASESAQPDWAASLGVELEPEAEGAESGGPLPSWLDDIAPGSETLEIEDDLGPAVASGSPFEAPDLGDGDEEEEQPKGTEDAQIPGWMSEAGWEQASGEAVERPVSFSESELSALERGQLPPEEGPAQQDTGELTPAEIPTWLEGRGPGAGSPQPADAQGEEGASTEETQPDWLADLAEPAPADAQAEGEEQDLTPDWLGEMAAGAEDTSEELPSFDFGEADEQAELAGEAAEPSDEGDVPAWLDESEPGATSTILTWLDKREDQEQPQAHDQPQDQPEEESVPEWMQAAMADEEGSVPSTAAEEPSPEAPPAWLSGLAEAAAESGDSEIDQLAELRGESPVASQEASPDEEPAAQPGEIPEWLMAIRGDEAAPGESEQDEFESELPEAFPWESEDDEEESPLGTASWPPDEEELSPETVETPTMAKGESAPPSSIPPAEGAAAASWLESLTEGEQDAWPSESEPTAAGGETSATSWLEDLGQGESEPPAQAPSLAEEPEWMRGLEDEGADDEAIGDVASSWLEGLADTLAETPAEPDEAGVGAAGLDEDVPTWLLDYEGSEAESESELPSPRSPDIATQAPDMEAPAPESAEDDTGRLKLLEELGLRDEQAEAETVPAQAGAEGEGYDLGQLEGMGDDQIFEWLEGLAGRDAPESEPDERSQAATRAEAPGQMEEIAAAETAEDMGAGLDWLEQLAEQRGISSEVESLSPRASQPPTPIEEPQTPAQPESRSQPPPEVPAPAEPTPEPPPAATPSAEFAPGTTEPAPTEAAPAEPEAEAPIDAPSAAEIPDWLIAPEDETPTETEPTPSPPSTAQPQPAAATVPAPTAAPKPETGAEPEAEPAVESERPIPVGPESASNDGLRRARRAIESGDLEAAVSEYGELIKARESLTQVVEDLEAALEAEPESSALWQALGDAYMKADRTSDAVKAYNRGMKETEVLNSARQALASGDAPRAAAQYGILIKRKKKLDDVIRDLENAVAQEDDQPMIWQVLGDAYMKADRLDESIQAYRKGMSSV